MTKLAISKMHINQVSPWWKKTRTIFGVNASVTARDQYFYLKTKKCYFVRQCYSKSHAIALTATLNEYSLMQIN